MVAVTIESFIALIGKPNTYPRWVVVKISWFLGYYQHHIPDHLKTGVLRGLYLENQRACKENSHISTRGSHTGGVWKALSYVHQYLNSILKVLYEV